MMYCNKVFMVFGSIPANIDSASLLPEPMGGPEGGLRGTREDEAPLMSAWPPAPPGLRLANIANLLKTEKLQVKQIKRGDKPHLLRFIFFSNGSLRKHLDSDH